MLLPMVGGMMISSIGTGRLVARYGKYKRFIVSGLAITAVSILALVTLQPDSPYWHQAIIMAFAGLGLGMIMPILTLAVQNEFTHKDLGSATSSIQLFRGLGSTVGTAIFSGILTAGIMNYIGDPNNIPYVQTLKSSPAASKIISGEIDADTLLQINMAEKDINQGIDQSLSQLPPVVAKVQKQKVSQQQDAFSTQIVDAFTKSLHNIFLISSIMMVGAFVIALFVEEKKLRDHNDVAQ